MNKKITLILFIIILNSNCSFDTRSGIWTKNQEISRTQTNNSQTKYLFEKEKIDSKEFNKSFLLKTPLKQNLKNNFLKGNNSGPKIIKISLNKKSKYKFSKIKYFNYFNPELVFNKKNFIFFDKKGTILKFNDTSKILWKKNNYSKKEKKLLPILNFSSNNKFLVVTDSLAKYYAVDIETGNVMWTKNHKSIFISEIKIDKDKFYVVDAKNNINCFSLSNGEKIWSFKTDDNFIKSQKKLSIVYDESKVYFNNSRGDIYSLDKENGNLIWLTPTRDDIDTFKSFLLKTSQLVLDHNNLFFSNNQNTFFSLDKDTGLINWSQNISSEFKPIISENIILTISSNGYFFIIEKVTGKIIRITDIFQNYNSKKRKKLKISGFSVGLQKIYVSLNTGKIIETNINDGRPNSILKISRDKISSPFINNGKMFIVKDDEIIKLN